MRFLESLWRFLNCPHHCRKGSLNTNYTASRTYTDHWRKKVASASQTDQLTLSRTIKDRYHSHIPLSLYNEAWSRYFTPPSQHSRGRAKKVSASLRKAWAMKGVPAHQDLQSKSPSLGKQKSWRAASSWMEGSGTQTLPPFCFLTCRSHWGETSTVKWLYRLGQH